jgi:hypothetical protein
MRTSNHRSRTWSALPIVAGSVLLALVSLTSPAQAAPPAGPPRPTPRATPQPAPVGALIELHVQFGPAWSKANTPWQSLWTVVQWQDHRGVWHDVKGWQGTLDQVVDGEGKKTWWLSKDLLNKGPFRWVVQRTQGGAWLATSERFYLPDATGRTGRVELSLERP